MIFWTRTDSPLGELVLVEEDGALVQLRQNTSQTEDDEVSESLKALDPEVYHQDTPFLNRVEAQLNEYFQGQRTGFDLNYRFHGTDFQRRVWEQIASIPYGETLTYGEIAERIDSPRASRAVGNACGNNPVSIVVPCHRVLAANGGLGGYSSGIGNKKKLLEIEGIV